MQISNNCNDHAARTVDAQLAQLVQHSLRCTTPYEPVLDETITRTQDESAFADEVLAARESNDDNLDFWPNYANSYVLAIR